LPASALEMMFRL